MLRLKAVFKNMMRNDILFVTLYLTENFAHP